MNLSAAHYDAIMREYDNQRLENMHALNSRIQGVYDRFPEIKQIDTQISELAENDLLLVAVSGKIGLAPTLAAIEKGVDIALANKETLVMAGDIVMAKARAKGVRIIPVDSEHSAIYQCIFSPENVKQVRKLIIEIINGSGANISNVKDSIKNIVEEGDISYIFDSKNKTVQSTFSINRVKRTEKAEDSIYNNYLTIKERTSFFKDQSDGEYKILANNLLKVTTSHELSNFKIEYQYLYR